MVKRRENPLRDGKMESFALFFGFSSPRQMYTVLFSMLAIAVIGFVVLQIFN